MDKEPNSKWKCKASVNLTHPSEEKVWSIFADFFSIHKWLPILDACYRIEGTSGKPGCVRRCSVIGGPGKDGKKKWAAEKLLEIDHSIKSFSYEITENNIGYSSYRATIKVTPRDDGERYGCRIEWSFVMDPMEGKAYEGMVAFQKFILQAIAKRIEEAHQHPTSTSKL